MESNFWSIFGIATALKVLLIPAYHSTDFEVHRNWLAITHSLPIHKWYVDATSIWTLDYPPFFAYFEWALSQVAKYVDPKMLIVGNLDYASEGTKNFQRASVMATDVVFALGAWRCLRAMHVSKKTQQHFAVEILLLLNVGLIFVDHIHFQYNGMLFGILLLSISFLLEERFLLSAFTFAILLNFKHIFLYMAPAFGVYLLKFYCLKENKNFVLPIVKVTVVGLIPFVVSFGPFWKQIPQVLARLFPFKRGLTHAYWAPNFWALYNVADKVGTHALGMSQSHSGTTSGLVQECEHVLLPQISPFITFLLTLVFMFPILVKLMLYTSKSDSKIVFLRAVVLCSCSSFMFGWHVHEKALLMCLIPMCLLYIVSAADAKHAFFLSAVGYFQLFPLLFQADLIIVRYSLYLTYIVFMYGQILRIYKVHPDLHIIERVYIYGFVLLPIYEHIISPLLGLNSKFPFMPLLLTSVYCSLGVCYFFISYYLYTLGITFSSIIHRQSIKSKTKSSSMKKSEQKFKAKRKMK